MKMDEHKIKVKNPRCFVLDNFLPKLYYESIRDEILDEDFPWWYSEDITNPDWDTPDSKKYGFSHAILKESGQILNNALYSILRAFHCELFSITNTSNVVKSRLDMTMYSHEKVKHIPHIDMFGCDKMLTTIFYFSDTDSETIVYDKVCTTKKDVMESCKEELNEIIRVKPRENRLLLFDGSLLHTGHSPSDCKRRILLNTNLI
jgi:hypothetical protein